MIAELQGGEDFNIQDNEIHKVCLPKDEKQIGIGKSLFGSCADSDMLLWLKRLAVDPCNSGASRVSDKKIWDQTLQVRKVILLSNADFPRRKRKLEQFVKGNFKSGSKVSSVNYNHKSCIKISGKQFSRNSSFSCLLNSADSTESLNQHIVHNSQSSCNSFLTVVNSCIMKQVSTDLYFLINEKDLGSTHKDFSLLVDSDESVNGPNSLSPINHTICDTPLLDYVESVISSNSSNSKEPKQVNGFIPDSLPKMVVPVGPRFQADIPDWVGPLYMETSDNSKWLGTRNWPDRFSSTKYSKKVIGKGRKDSCLCVSPGSPDCFRHHIVEETLDLKYELGQAFFGWKFDEMGENILKEWSWEEQKRFESLIDEKNNFWQNSMDFFPDMPRKKIISYYLNVYVPRRISLQIISKSKQVDSDDEVEKVSKRDSHRRYQVKSQMLGKSRFANIRYLQHPR